MVFKLPESYYARQREEYEKKYIKIGETMIHVSELDDRSVTSEDRSKMEMNSYAQNDLPPKLTTEALIETTKYYKSQCSTPRICSTYNESIIHKLVPELIKRLEEKEEVF